MIHSIGLTREETIAFYNACKKNRRAVSAVVNAILIIADVDTALRLGAIAGADELENIKQIVEASESFPVAINAADRVEPLFIRRNLRLTILFPKRPFLSRKHANIMAPGGTPGLVIDIFPTFHDMQKVRKCVWVDEDGSISKDFSQRNFWDGLVAHGDELLRHGAKVCNSPL